QRGTRAEKAFVIVDCGAISPNLVESELFGHVRGAFTGADRDRVGAFEAANGGTVFLDEIGELPLELPPKLLRALESREPRAAGAPGPPSEPSVKIPFKLAKDAAVDAFERTYLAALLEAAGGNISKAARN